MEPALHLRLEHYQILEPERNLLQFFKWLYQPDLSRLSLISQIIVQCRHEQNISFNCQNMSEHHEYHHITADQNWNIPQSTFKTRK